MTNSSGSTPDANAVGAANTSVEGSTDSDNTGNNKTSGTTAMIQHLINKQETEMDKN